MAEGGGSKGMKKHPERAVRSGINISAHHPAKRSHWLKGIGLML
jgi:hypothetical protein